MNGLSDIDRVAALRPRTSVDARWPAAQRDAALHRILAEAPMPRTSRQPGRESRRRWLRRPVLVLVATLGVAGAGAGVATASGILPDSFTRPFSGWKQDVGVDPQTAVRAGSVPGPDATVFTVWTAEGDNGSACVGAGFESAESAKAAVPTSFNADTATCVTAARRAEPFPFGDSVGVGGSGTVYTFTVSAGTTASAKVRLADGTLMPTVRAHDEYLGWYPLQPGAANPQLIAYDSAGKPVGRLTFKTPGR